MPSIEESIILGTELLTDSGVAEPRSESRSLLAFVLKKSKSFLIAHPEYELSKAEVKQFEGFVKRRANREPLQHITGTQEFWGLDFEVSTEVLIPRPETEIIVEKAVSILSEIESPTFCEVGIGSGCISASILLSVPTAEAVGLDISKPALNVARRNAEKNNVSDRLELKLSDVFSALERPVFDMIVSNPPYIPLADFLRLQPEVRDFDPRIALTDEGNGLAIIEKIILESPTFLRPGGFLITEIGVDQAEFVNELFDREVWTTVEILLDLQGIPRTVFAQKL